MKIENLIALGILALLALGVYSILTGDTSLMDIFFAVTNGGK